MTAVHAPVDEVAVRDLDTAAQRAGLDGPTITRDGGPTAIRFESLARFAEWCDFGLIRIRNAYEIVVEGAETHVPVLFGHPNSWNAVAIYPAQDACTCGAELVHRCGCPADEVGPVVVLDVPVEQEHRMVRIVDVIDRNPQAEVDAFNAAHPVGTVVRYWRGVREGEPSGTGATRTEAQVLSGHTAVVWIHGCSGCIALSHVQPVTYDGGHAALAEALVVETSGADVAGAR